MKNKFLRTLVLWTLIGIVFLLIPIHSSAFLDVPQGVPMCKLLFTNQPQSIFKNLDAHAERIEFYGLEYVQVRTLSTSIAEFRLAGPRRSFGRLMSLRLHHAEFTSGKPLEQGKIKPSVDYLTSSVPILILNSELSNTTSDGSKKQEYYIGHLKSLDLRTDYEVVGVVTSTRNQTNLLVARQALIWTPLSPVIMIYEISSDSLGKKHRQLLHRIEGPGALMSIRNLTNSK